MSILRRIDQERRAKQIAQGVPSSVSKEVPLYLQKRHQTFARFKDATKPYDYDELRRCMEAQILLEAQPRMGPRPPPAEVEIKDILEDVISSEQLTLNPETVAKLYKDILDNVLGLSVLEPLIADASITKIIVYSPTEIDVVQNGNLTRSQVTFDDENHLLRIVDQLAMMLWTYHYLEAQSIKGDGVLPNGIEIDGIFPTQAQQGPVLTLNKRSLK